MQVDRGGAPRRIAVVRALQLGDLLLAVPALRAIRAGFPEAEITLIGLPWAAAFARRFDHLIDRFAEFPGYPGIAESPYVPARTTSFVTEARGYGYDLVIQMHGSGRSSNPFALALGGRATAGYYDGDVPDGLAPAAPYPHDRHEIERNLGLATLLGCLARGLALEFPLVEADHAEAAVLTANVVERGRPIVCIHPGARPPARRWVPSSFAALADHLVRRWDAQVILTGGPGEQETVHVVAACMESPAIDLAGRTSIGALAAIVAQADLFVSNDTGPAHLAEAVGTPTVTVFGPADPHRWASLDPARHPIVRHPVPCSPCTHWVCPIDHPCLRLIDPSSVAAVADTLLATGVMTCSA